MTIEDTRTRLKSCRGVQSRVSESKVEGKKVRDEPDRPTIGCCMTLSPMRVSVVGVPFWLRKFGRLLLGFTYTIRR